MNSLVVSRLLTAYSMITTPRAVSDDVNHDYVILGDAVELPVPLSAFFVQTIADFKDLSKYLQHEKECQILY